MQRALLCVVAEAKRSLRAVEPTAPPHPRSAFVAVPCRADGAVHLLYNCVQYGESKFLTLSAGADIKEGDEICNT